jgi:molecular chaperone GrpE
MSVAQNSTQTQGNERGGTQALDERPAVPADASSAPAGTPAAPGPSVAELEDRWRRAVAELDNVRKRFERQLAEQARAERARTAAAFLPVLDNLELALRHAAADPTAIVTGVQAVHQQALDVLAGLGYQRIVPVRERFDPTRHEAARTVPAGDGVEAGTVVEVHRAGYLDPAGMLVRPAVVTVAQAADRATDEGRKPGGYGQGDDDQDVDARSR